MGAVVRGGLGVMAIVFTIACSGPLQLANIQIGRSLNQDGSVKIPAELLLDEIKQTPYAERAALRARLAESEKRMDDQMPEWEARKNSLPEKERIAAEDDFKQLKRSRENLRQKIDGVENASAETWNSAKADLHVVLLDTVQTYKKLRARFST